MRHPPSAALPVAPRRAPRWGKGLASAAALAAALLLPACGGGGGGGGGTSADEDPAVALAPVSAVSDDDAAAFLVRTSFAATPADLASVQSVGLPAYADAMVEWADDPALDAEARALFVHPTPTAAPVRNPANARLLQSRNEPVRYWLHILRRTQTPFRERMALLWHDHFATSTTVLESSEYYMALEHLDLLRGMANGNVKELVYRLSIDPLMLIWLSGKDSTRQAPNENFPRELWELFTLGVDEGYTQADIEEAARCFTGWRLRTNAVDPSATFRFADFDPARHDTGAKTIFGRTIAGRTSNDFTSANGANEYRDVVELTFAERPAAEFICRRLFEELCYAPAPPAIVASLAQDLRSAGYELKPVLKRILKSQAMFSARTAAGQSKSPIEYTVGFSRATGLTLTASSLQNRLNSLGMIPTQAPVVAGWPSGALWLTADAMVDRANFVREAIAQRQLDITPLIPPAGAQRTAEAVVDALAARLRVRLTSEDRTDLVTYLNSDHNGTTTIVSPFDGTSAQHVSRRVRGLLYILAQHPSYHVR